MALKWSDIDSLAQELEKLYPETDLSVLEYDELRKLVAGVNGFDDKTVPDEEDMEAVINAWINIQFPEEPERVKSGDID
ncbi:MAG: Fe-S cluster assembly protein IscX [Alphaproteobacteria bacterium]|nr:Fe-S cluster assembly protein IscX [Alphaproteobacteria bacterium]